jgi:myo-inositol-1(or 4)-monophosphatase
MRGVAERLAVAAGEVLLVHAERRSGRGVAATSKAVRRELVTEADRAAEEVVVGGLLAEFPTHAVLAEEGVRTPAGAISRPDAEWLWIVDPLDGTTNFVHGLPHFGVAIGLAWRGRPVLGVVHAPALATTWAAVQGGGAVRNGEPIEVAGTVEVADALLATGFAYVRNEPGVDDNTGRFAAAVLACRDLRRLGSAEIDLCHVADGRFDGYWEMHLKPYDVAAGAVIVQEAGGVVTDLRGGDDWLFGEQVLAANAGLHPALLALVGDSGSWRPRA